MKQYRIDVEGDDTVVEASSMSAAVKKGEAWVRDGDWGDSSETQWVDFAVTRMLRGKKTDESESHTATIAATEPPCPGYRSHRWVDNDNTRGNGGGVTYSHTCSRCGCVRHTDTWAQRRDTGEQGLTRVRFEVPTDRRGEED